MPRRISSGKVGRSVLGDIFAQDNAIRSVETNANIAFSPDGSGIVESDSDIQTNAQAGIRFADSDSSNYVKVAAPATVASNVTLTLPGADGTDGQVLKTDGNGVLSFANNFLQIQDRSAADPNTYYIAMVDEDSKDGGNEDTLSIASDRMSFVPNPGILTVNSFVCDNVDIGGGSLDNVTIGSNTAASFTGSVDINSGTIDGTTIGGSAAAVGTFTTLNCDDLIESSSAILKENIQPLNNVLDKLLNLKPVMYDRKNGLSKNEPGLLAEEVEKILPNIVYFDENKAHGVRYSKLTAYLLSAIQEIYKELQEVKKINGTTKK